MYSLCELPSHGECPHCGASSRFELLYREDDQTSRDEHILIENCGALMRCGACDKLFAIFGWAWEEIDNSEIPEKARFKLKNNDQGYTYAPAQKRFQKRYKALGLDRFDPNQEALQNVLEQSYIAADNGLNILAATGLRSVVEAFAVLRGAEKRTSFSEKVAELAKQQWISHRDTKTVLHVIQWGNRSAHEQVGPNDKQLDQLFKIVEAMLFRDQASRDAGLFLEN